MFCPECHSEYREGVEVCEACGGIALVPELRHAEVLSVNTETVPVSLNKEPVETVDLDGESLNPNQLFLLEHGKELEYALQGASIPTLLRPMEHIIFPDQRPRFEVHVLPKDFEQAQDLLDRRWRETLALEGAELSQPADLETCPACGANVPANVAECPDCGLVVGIAEEDGAEEDGAEEEA